MMNKHLLSSNKNEWGTPTDLFTDLDNEYDFTLDPCGYNGRKLKEDMKTNDIRESGIDGLKMSWKDERVFVNPPYGRELKHWVKKCYDERDNAEVIVLLIPSRTDTSYFHNYIYNCVDKLIFLRGRLKFIDLETLKAVGSSTFPSLLAIWDNRNGVKRNVHD